MSKIDRLVAEKVLKWDIDNDCPYSVWQLAIDSPFFAPYHNHTIEKAPPFSTNMGTAWEVFRYMQNQTKGDGTRKYLLAIIDDIAHVEVRIETVCMEDYHICSVPHGQEAKGICLAALRAVGVSESEIKEALT